MTITIAYGINDSTVEESRSGEASTWLSACTGTNVHHYSGGDPGLQVGGECYGSSSFYAWQTHQKISASRASTDRVVCAYLTTFNDGLELSNDNWDMYAYHHPDLYTTHRWVDAGDAGATLCGIVPNAGQTASTSTPMLGGSVGLVGLLNAGTSTTLDLAFLSSLQTKRIQPSNSNVSQASFIEIYGADRSGTTYDPRVTYSTVPLSNALGPGSACVQLADGTTMHVSYSGDLTGLTLYRRKASADTVVASSMSSILTQAAGVASSSGAGLQVIAVTRDAADNVYVLVGAGGSLYAQAFAKTAPDTWTPAGMLSQTLPVYDTETGAWPHNTVAVWHSTGGTAGTIVAVGHYAQGDGDTASQWYALVNCDSLLAGSGTLFRGTGNGTTLFPLPSVTAWTTYQNETGTGLDIAASGASTGFAATYNRRGQLTYCGYTLAADGASFSTVTTSTITDTIYKDANSKLRVLAYSATVMVLAYGSQVRVRQLSGGSWVALGTVDLSAQSMTTFPTAAAMLATAAWDITYDPVAGKLYYYYLSAADGRRLMRTSISVSTWLAARDETQIAATVGAGGSTNPHLRVHRGTTPGYTTLITASNVASGVHTNVYVEDTSQAPPSAPTLTPKANFDATASAVFGWTFTDPNAGDTQSAYQLQIVTSEGAATYDSGKVTSGTSSHTLTAATITNPGSWQWRVRTYDSVNQVSPWSAYSSFQTSAGGNVTITDPAADNPVGLDTASITVTWSLSGSTQAAYRVVVTATGAGTTLSDTGWVTSTDTTYTVTGMLTDVEYQISVKTRNAGLVEAGAGLRLVTPSFGTPMTPTITAAGDDTNALVTITVTNPTPVGDRPEVTSNVVARRVTGVGAYELIGSCGHNSSYNDYTAAAGVTYDYVVIGTASQGATASAAAAAATSFQGVWIHDPGDPAGTVHPFLYGKSNRTAGVAVTAQGQHYAGRTYPVYDFGEHQDDTLALRLDLPYGTAYAADLAAIRGFVQARRALCVRDNRGRVRYAALGDYQETDQDWGTQAQVKATTVDYTVVVS